MKVIKKSTNQTVNHSSPNLQKYNTTSARLIFLLKLLVNDTMFS